MTCLGTIYENCLLFSREENYFLTQKHLENFLFKIGFLIICFENRLFSRTNLICLQGLCSIQKIIGNMESPLRAFVFCENT